MLAKPTISVVMCCYNAAKYLQQAIESMVKQSYTHWELIVVIDGETTDNTYNIVQKFALQDKRISIIQWHERINIPIALNEGFKKASGEYFTFLHADDAFTPHALQEMLTVLQQNPTVDALYANHTVIDENGKVLFEKSFADINKSIAFFTGAGLALLYKREVFTAIKGYDVNSFMVEDYIFWIRVWVSGKKIMHLNRADLHFYRVSNFSISVNKTAIIQTRFNQVFQEYLPLLLPKLPAKEVNYLLGYYAQYYSCSNIHLPTAKKYLQQLAANSTKAAVKTVLIIVVKKIFQALKAIVLLPLMLASCFIKK